MMRGIQIRTADHILFITVSRPEALNALNQELINQLYDALQQAYQNSDVWGLVITGDGDKAFVAGADIQELASLSPAEARKLSEKGQKVFKYVEDFPKPVLAAVNGFALGGGCELAMACHVRIATKSAKFGQPEVNLGIIPGYGGTQRLAQLVGRGKALELIMTGDLIAADEAKTIGLVNHVVETREQLQEMCVGMLKKVFAKGPMAVSQVIKAVNAGFLSEDHGYRTEAEGFAFCAGTEDFKEGTSAFLGKRKPIFTGK